jgi:hypothetical protein
MREKRIAKRVEKIGRPERTQAVAKEATTATQFSSDGISPGRAQMALMRRVRRRSPPGIGLSDGVESP